MLLVLLLATRQPIAAQNSPEIVFLAQADDNKTGSIALEGPVHLYISQNNSIQQISKPDEDVASFGVSLDFSKIAYAAHHAGGFTLQIVDIALAKAVAIDLPGLASVSSVTYTPTMIWITAISTDSKAGLIGIATSEPKIVTQRLLFSDDTNLAISHSGKWLLAYTVPGKPELYGLPDFNPVSFQTDPGTISFGEWSPSADTVQMMIEGTTNERTLLLVDPSTGKGTAIAIPIQDPTANVSAVWSSHGQRLVVTEADADVSGAVVKTNVTLVDASTGKTTPVVPSGTTLSVLSWSPADTYALIFSPVSSTNPSGYSVFDPAAQTIIPLQIPNQVQLEDVTWSPVAATLAALGQSPTIQQYGVFTSGTTLTDPLKTLLVSTDAQLSQANLYWSGDGSKIIVVSLASGSGDSAGKATLTGGQIYSLDATSGALNRITPDGVAVLAASVYVR